MKLYVNQSIIIHSLKVGSVTTSSVFQIGSVGSIKALSKFTNTGDYTEEARPLEAKGQIISTSFGSNGS
ncbi:spore germination protein GerPB [Bacillus sp. 165]|uniref:spore germination protein GerPB n=1 Tax=Bacillus sp. 165 TaxID=1529117 RepID=UPI001ADBACFF|nr:spore germination protein GerPB [Bacillus sp. 165]MBO9128698.1 spore gernimation protein GerPB [Bacillus sp. 165]